MVLSNSVVRRLSREAVGMKDRQRASFLPLSVLYEDNHLLVVNKPPGLATMGAGSGRLTLLELAKDYLKKKYRKPGNVFLASVSRLDEFVSGVIVLARTSKSAARLSRQFAGRTVEKLYWAVVSGTDIPASGSCVDSLQKDEAAHRMIVVPPSSSAQIARLEYRVIGQRGDDRFLEIKLLTGRKHQIRVQFSCRGWPILGDRKYGSRRRWAERAIGLHGRSIGFEHPTHKTPMHFQAVPPPNWRPESFGIDYS